MSNQNSTFEKPLVLITHQGGANKPDKLAAFRIDSVEKLNYFLNTTNKINGINIRTSPQIEIRDSLSKEGKILYKGRPDARSVYQNLRANLATEKTLEEKIVENLKKGDVIKNFVIDYSHLEVHNKRNDVAVFNRMLKFGKRPNSTFNSTETMNRTLEKVILERMDDIVYWTENEPNEAKLELLCQMDGPIGHGYIYDKHDYRIKEVETEYVSCVLVRDDKMPCGFGILTAYPNCDTRYVEVEKTGRNIRPLLEKTYTYESEKESEQEWLEFLCDPDPNRIDYPTFDAQRRQKKAKNAEEKKQSQPQNKPICQPVINSVNANTSNKNIVSKNINTKGNNERRTFNSFKELASQMEYKNETPDF